MFDIGWTEMLVVAVVMIVIVGPKDLPRMLRTFGKSTAKLRSMAGDFQKQFNEALKEAELDDIKDSVDSLRKLNPTSEIRKQLNPFEKAAADVRSGLEAAMKPKADTSAKPADADAHAAEPLKNGAAAETPKFDGPGETPSPAKVAGAGAKPSRKKAQAEKPAKKAATSKSGNGAAAKSAARPATRSASAPAPKKAGKPAAAAGKPAAAKKSSGKTT